MQTPDEKDLAITNILETLKTIIRAEFGTTDVARIEAAAPKSYWVDAAQTLSVYTNMSANA